IWVHVGQDGTVLGADGSFHGGFTPLKWQGVSQFTDDHIHAYCQPGKHAFVADAAMAKAVESVEDTISLAAIRKENSFITELDDLKMCLHEKFPPLGWNPKNKCA
ncbi:MAG: hypothetical protein IJJ84_03375, partial [Kiritimatiellae bacterium]|nr:hypothetical protein [Kiritimatiellia bacterium]